MGSVFLYLSVFLIVFVVQVCAMRQKNKIAQKFLVVVSFAIILFLIGLRYKVGTDYEGYISAFNRYGGESFSEIWSERGDIGSKIIIGLSSHLCSDVKIIFWIYGLLALYPIYKINKNSGFKYLAYSTLIYNLTILPPSLNIMRQGAAMSFVVLAFTYAFERHPKPIKSLFCMVLAVFLHTSAMLMLPYLFIYYMVRKNQKKSYIGSTLAVTAIVSFALMTVLKNLFINIGFSDYNYILSSTRDVQFSLPNVVCDVVYYAVLLWVLLLSARKRGGVIAGYDAGNAKELFALVLSGSILHIVGSATKYLSRIEYYFQIFQIILIPMAIQGISDKKTRVLAKMTCVLFFVALFVIRCYVQGWYEIIPYQTWLALT